MREDVLIYDGACPFCREYVRRTRLKATVPELRLVDARAGGPEVQAVRDDGLVLDDGMVLRLAGLHHHGADALHHLALLSSRSHLFNRLNHWIFRNPMRARLLYPLLRAGRNAALALLRRKKLGF